jgi:uncharacterized protein (TIGR02444 family)
MIIGADSTHMNQTNTDSNPLWKFSLATYAQAGVAAACLDLQESFGVDVNVLLYVCWYASEGRALTAKEIAAADAHIADWRHAVVHPIRALRQGLREYPGAETTRTVIKQAELQSERVQQQNMHLYSLSSGWEEGGGDLHGNLQQFASFQGCPPQVLAAFEEAISAALKNSLD